MKTYHQCPDTYGEYAKLDKDAKLDKGYYTYCGIKIGLMPESQDQWNNPDYVFPDTVWFSNEIDEDLGRRDRFCIVTCGACLLLRFQEEAEKQC